MQDNREGTKVPFRTLSPQNEDMDGPKYDPVSAGEVPKDPAGFLAPDESKKRGR